MDSFEIVQPLYTVYYYTDFLYRVVKFKRRSDGFRLVEADGEGPQERFMQSYCRSRSMVLQYGLCNSWDYFITITVSPKRFDRWNLDKIYRYLAQWFRDYRKRYRVELAYLLVPEHHKDGAWHFHGFIRGVVSSHLSRFVRGIHPEKLVLGNYLNWGHLGVSIGYVSLAPLRDPVGAAFYVVKYITKEHAHDDFYQHLYYHSQGLKTAKPVLDCYCYNNTLESCLQHESDFCFCGWAKNSDFTWPYSLSGCEARFLEDLTPLDETALDCAPDELDFVQVSIQEWLDFASLPT